jgi:Family of unknown function (DUF6270)
MIGEAMGTAHPLERQVVIHGSCVSRDCFNFPLAQENLQLVDYFSRSSLATHGTGAYAIADSDLRKLTSRFQRDQVLRDARRSFRWLESSRGRLLLVDLIDERFHLVVVDGCLLTRSTELLESGHLEGREVRTIRRGTPAHTTRWENGIQAFAARIAVLAPHRVVIHRAFWCESYRDAAGIVHPYPDEERELAKAINAQLQRQYDQLSQVLGHPQNIDLFTEGAVLGTTEHRWGLTPYHYEDEYYIRVVEQLLD